MQELNLRRRYGIWVVGVKQALTGHLDMFPDGQYRLGTDQILLVVGKQADLNQFNERP
jgi:Trk K+ transport system NAD-binding subunit